MLSESIDNREMSAYDDMCVQMDATLVAHVVSSNTSTSSYTSKKIFLWRTLAGWARIGLLLLLVVSSASAGPVRERRAHRPSTHARHTSLEWHLTPQRLRRSEPRQHSSSSSRGGSSRYSSMGDQPDEARSGRNSRSMGDVHWSQPCSGLQEFPKKEPHILTEHILRELAVAKSFLEDFRDEYARSLQNSPQDKPWESLLADTPYFDFTFLDTSAVENENDFNLQLLHAYEKMQRLAVGIEQVTLDQALYEGTLLNKFKDIETHIVKILCQLHFAMVHRDLQPPTTVTKDIMGAVYRDQDDTSQRKYRDVAIVREYNTTIQDLVTAFQRFEKK